MPTLHGSAFLCVLSLHDSAVNPLNPPTADLAEQYLRSHLTDLVEFR